MMKNWRADGDVDLFRLHGKAVVTMDAFRKHARSVETGNGLAICAKGAGVQFDLEATAIINYWRDDGDVDLLRLHAKAVVTMDASRKHARSGEMPFIPMTLELKSTSRPLNKK